MMTDSANSEDTVMFDKTEDKDLISQVEKKPASTTATDDSKSQEKALEINESISKTEESEGSTANVTDKK